MKMYDVKVNEIPKYLTENPTDKTHSIVMHEKGETLLIPLYPHGVTSYFTSRSTTMEDYNNCTHFSATAVDPEWDTHDPIFSAQEDAFLTTGGFLRERLKDFRGNFMAGINSNPYKSHQECGD